ncbi:MAG: type I 3-dehydroquinate dehydratase [Candidatus Caldarchaeum sp.]
MSKTRICVSVYGENEENLAENIRRGFEKGADLAEVRLDLSGYNSVESLAEKLRPFADRLVLTLRPMGEGGKSSLPVEERVKILRRLADIRPAYIDLELSTLKQYPADEFRRAGVKVIASWHSFESTPDDDSLSRLCEECLRHGDVAKVVTFSTGPRDNIRVISLYTKYPPRRLIAFCMGEQGWITRILSMAADAPIAYAALGDAKTAPGQLTLEEMLMMRENICRGGGGG